MSLNVVSLAGRLVADPELRSVGDDKQVCNFTLAIDNRGKDRGASFVDCIAWNGAAGAISKYVKKGQMFGVVGRLYQQTWEKDGRKNSKISVVVDDFTFIEPKKSEESENIPSADDLDKPISIEDIPF